MANEGHPSQRPATQNSLNYGKYIIQAAGCIECHTPVTDKGALIMEKSFSGGREFPLEGGRTIVSTNITFDTMTGIGKWDKERFIHLFNVLI